MDTLEKIGDTRAIAQIIIETIKEPLLILDRDLRIILATNSFHKLFGFPLGDVEGKGIFELDGGAWNIPVLAELLRRTVGEQTSIENFEISHEFSAIGRRTLLVCTRLVRYDEIGRTTVFLSFEDVTERRAIELEKEHLQHRTRELLEQKEILLREMEHRVVNSLQIIASILMLKAKAVSSPETRHHLEDAHRRVMSIAAVQRHLHTLSHADMVDVAPYLTKLCQSLADSIIAEGDGTKLTVRSDAGATTSADAVSLGLIVTELVINALKYAFPERRENAAVEVIYETNDADWRLSIVDNGVGMATEVSPLARVGLGTSLVKALAGQMNAQVSITSSATGTNVAITHATFSKPSHQ